MKLHSVALLKVLMATTAASNLSDPVSNLSVNIDAIHTEITACDALAATTLRDRLLLPTDPNYDSKLETWFSKIARLRPWCILLPQSPAEVSLALTTLVGNNGNGTDDWHVALRSGGHGPPGSNNIAEGVTIDLSSMNASSYDESTNMARLEPGARWRSAYTSLSQQGVTVVGGRDGSVGVGGFLLGGGISFFTPKMGFGCDSVMNYEVVLADGSIVNANQTANPDLYHALKGGGSNFGIVTRYDMEAIPDRGLAHDVRFLSINCTDMVLDAVVDFAEHDELQSDDALVTFFTHGYLATEEINIGVIHVNTAGDFGSGTSADPIKEVPAVLNSTTVQTMAEIAASGGIESDTWNAERTLLLRNDVSLLRHCVKLHEEYVEHLKHAIGADNFVTTVFFQPVPSYISQIGRQRGNGGNVLGLEAMAESDVDAVLWTGGVAVSSDAGSLTVAEAALSDMTTEIQEYAAETGGALDFVYMNYAAPDQDPIGSYGEERVQLLRDVAVRYDPEGVFQKRFPGGFKIGSRDGH